jgi:SAM-dependent methyltransferase
MLNKRQEYAKMASVEQQLWWYRALHQLVFESIQRHFSRRDITVLDAGCGTGGLMLKLKSLGYLAVRGVDLSEYAVDICRHRQLEVAQDNLLNLATQFEPRSMDVIVSNDTLCYLSEGERAKVIQQCLQLLKRNGLLIFNVPAFAAFRGVHDLSVGIKHRFSKREIPKLLDSDQFKIVRQVYWPFLLSPLIFLVRTGQRIKLRMGLVKEIHSDIDLPVSWINRLLFRLNQFENRTFTQKPFGSSLFVVAQKIHA